MEINFQLFLQSSQVKRNLFGSKQYFPNHEAEFAGMETSPAIRHQKQSLEYGEQTVALKI